MNGSNERLFWQSNQVGVRFLFTDLETAHTLMDIADATENPETRIRNQRHAQRAYFTVRRLIPRLTFSQEELVNVDRTLTDLRKRLQEAGSLLVDE